MTLDFSQNLRQQFLQIFIYKVVFFFSYTYFFDDDETITISKQRTNDFEV